MKQKEDRVITAIKDMVFNHALDGFEVIKTADEWTYRCLHCGKRFIFPVTEPSKKLKNKYVTVTFPEMIEHAKSHQAERRR
jgi:hypothetical protein